MSILQETQQDREERKIQSEEFTDRIISMPLFNDFGWKTNDENFFRMQINPVTTLDDSGSWIGRKVVWKFCTLSMRRIGVLWQQSGKTIQRNWSYCVQSYQCVELWDLEEEEG